MVAKEDNLSNRKDKLKPKTDWMSWKCIITILSCQSSQYLEEEEYSFKSETSEVVNEETVNTSFKSLKQKTNNSLVSPPA